MISPGPIAQPEVGLAGLVEYRPRPGRVPHPLALSAANVAVLSVRVHVVLRNWKILRNLLGYLRV